MPPTEDHCRICSAVATTRFTAREMMYGTRETFDYFECPDCGCVQIATIPGDLGRFYPRDYYSFQSAAPSLRQQLKFATFRLLAAAAALAPALRARLARRSPRLARLFLYIEATRGNRDAAILDVGAGGGELVKELADIGYRNVLGIDAFLDQPMRYRGRVMVAPQNLSQVTERYDIVSFHHSLEHMADQAAVLRSARDVLKPGGRLLIRIPVVGGEAWTRYRADWVQLDPPRHLYLHSIKSFKLAANQAELKVAQLDYDSTGFQFWGSELFRRDIPLNDPRSPGAGADELAAFEDQARKLNRAGRGDQIVAWLVAV